MEQKHTSSPKKKSEQKWNKVGTNMEQINRPASFTQIKRDMCDKCDETKAPAKTKAYLRDIMRNKCNKCNKTKAS
jgi:hypothetical protein